MFMTCYVYIMFCQLSFYTDLHFPFLILEFRCNQNADCNDESDERDCRITVIDEKQHDAKQNLSLKEFYANYSSVTGEKNKSSVEV